MLLAGFQALLARLANQNDVVVGIPVAGQTAEGHQELVGHAVSMLPIRTQLDPHKPVKALLSDVRTHLLEAQEHQSFTIGALLKKLPIKRDPSRLPLMSVIFNVDRGLGPSGLPFSGLQGALSANARRAETYELFVNAVEYGGKITLECQYNTDLFDRATIQRWLAAYERLMRGFVTDLESQAGAALGTMPLLSDDELKQLDAWNAESHLPLESGVRVHDLIGAQCKRSPDAPAIRFEGRTLTYRQLDARSDALARKLRDLGVKRGQRVGLAVERSPELVVGLYGIIKAGAAYVPLDPGYPKDRLAFMVQDGALNVVVSQKKTAQELDLGVKNLVLVEDLPAEAPPLQPSADDAQAEDPCYVIYTSGSTGKPKGVLVPHRSVVNIIESCRRTPGMTDKDVVLAVTTLSFDIAVSELLLPFTAGATVEIASREVASDGAKLLSLLRSSGANFMDATPATYRLLLSAGWSGGDLKKCVCTGEAMPKDLAQELVKRIPSVWNGYGPTETTVWSSFYEVKPPVEKILIGKPVANTQLYILDAQRQRVPLGVIGELYIGGRGVTLGYHGRPELTADRFVQNPFGPGLLYRTGDLVRYQRDGNVECLGRNDNQVKVRGFRIELGEIEDQLTQHPAVKQAAVIVREFKANDVRLVGYVVQHAAQTVSDADLRAHLKKTLPDYMVPAHLVKLDRMPLTPSGKIDRKSLPAPDTSAGLSDSFVAPRTDTERGLAEIWQQILSVGRVGATDDFFALGGHSLLASQLLSRVQQRFGAQLSFRKIFEAPTVEKLATLVDQSKSSGPVPAQVAIPKRADRATAPLSVAQARLVLLEQMDPSTRQVHALCAKWRLTGPMNAEAMHRAFAELVVRHEPLRSTLRVQPGGRQVVVIHPDRRIWLDELDVSALSTEAQDDRAIAVLRDYGMRPFDLDWEPPIRLMMMKRGEQEHELLLGVHNFAWDGWSFDLFLKDMSALYGAFAEGKPSPLPPLPVTYGDFAAWQQQFLDSPEANRQVAYWQEQLKEELAPLDFPTDVPRMGSRSSAGANEGIEISQEIQDALVALAQRESTTLFAVVFAAFNIVLSRHTGQRDLLVGCPVRARTRPELEDVVGPFTNNVLLRTQITEGMTFLQLLQGVKDKILDAFSNQEVPIERLGVKPPLVRAFFSLQDARTRPANFGPMEVRQLHTRPPNAANEMMLWTMQRKHGLLAMLNYSTDLFKAEVDAPGAPAAGDGPHRGAQGPEPGGDAPAHPPGRGAPADRRLRGPAGGGRGGDAVRRAGGAVQRAGGGGRGLGAAGGPARRARQVGGGEAAAVPGAGGRGAGRAARRRGAGRLRERGPGAGRRGLAAVGRRPRPGPGGRRAGRPRGRAAGDAPAAGAELPQPRRAAGPGQPGRRLGRAGGGPGRLVDAGAAGGRLGRLGRRLQAHGGAGAGVRDGGPARAAPGGQAGGDRAPAAEAVRRAGDAPGPGLRGAGAGVGGHPGGVRAGGDAAGGAGLLRAPAQRRPAAGAGRRPGDGAAQRARAAGGGRHPDHRPGPLPHRRHGGARGLDRRQGAVPRQAGLHRADGAGAGLGPQRGRRGGAAAGGPRRRGAAGGVRRRQAGRDVHRDRAAQRGAQGGRRGGPADLHRAGRHPAHAEGRHRRRPAPLPVRQDRGPRVPARAHPEREAARRALAEGAAALPRERVRELLRHRRVLAPLLPGAGRAEGPDRARALAPHHAAGHAGAGGGGAGRRQPGQGVDPRRLQ